MKTNKTRDLRLACWFFRLQGLMHIGASFAAGNSLRRCHRARLHVGEEAMVGVPVKVGGERQAHGCFAQNYLNRQNLEIKYIDLHKQIGTMQKQNNILHIQVKQSKSDAERQHMEWTTEEASLVQRIEEVQKMSTHTAAASIEMLLSLGSRTALCRLSSSKPNRT